MRITLSSFAGLCVLTTGATLSSAALAREPDSSRPGDHTHLPGPNDPAARAGGFEPADQMVFISGDTLRGKKVYNAAQEDLASIDDLIIDRGSGQIAYLILKTGTTMGLGGKLVVAPYSAFGWDQIDKHVLLSSTPADIKTWPEFDKSKWATGARDETSLSRTLGRQYYKPGSSEPMYPASKNLQDSRIKGKIARISRQPVAGGPEDIVVTVTTDDNQTRDVTVAPSWYVAGNTFMFYRDAPVDMRVVQVDRDGRQTLLARSVSLNSQDTPLYDEHGVSNWSFSKNSSTRTSDVYTPFVLSRDIVGKKVECRGEACGKVADLIIECKSGHATFLSIDPDQNLLGIGDTKRLVPWSVVTAIGADKVMLDASKPMIVSAEQVPSDLKNLGGDAMTYKNAFQPYDVPPQMYGRPRADRP